MSDRRFCCCLSRRILVLIAAAYAYFVIYPDDIEALFTPLIMLSGSVADVAGGLGEITNRISPWFWVFASICALAWTVTRIWGRR